MRGFSATSPHATLRARRWDVIVLGGALPGLVAAARLGMRRLRVLVVEEGAAARSPPALREPFLLGGGGSVLDACLRALTLPLIDRRRLKPTPLAYQVVFPDARVDVGSPLLTAEELVAWGLTDAETAFDLMHSLERAAQAELAALLPAPIVRSGGLRSLIRASAPSSGPARGLPAEAAQPPEELLPFLGAQVRALSNLGGMVAPPEARARLLGSGLEASACFPRGEDSLRGLLCRRVRAVHGEFRTLEQGFELVTVGSQPGVADEVSGEVWAGRAMLVNAPSAPLAGFLEQTGKERPDFLPARRDTHRRVAVRFRAPRSVVPEGMSRRVIHVDGPERRAAEQNITRLGLFPVPERGDCVDLVAAAVVPRQRADPGSIGGEFFRIASSLMPFSESKLVAIRDPAPLWDDDGGLADPAPGAGWPGELEIRASSRPLVYRLPLEGVAALGLEGDLLLGWRAGDAIGSDLS